MIGTSFMKKVKNDNNLSPINLKSFKGNKPETYQEFLQGSKVEHTVLP